MAAENSKLNSTNFYKIPLGKDWANEGGDYYFPDVKLISPAICNFVTLTVKFLPCGWP